MYDVTVVNDPHSFKKSYESTRPDRIVMDIIMPDIDGIELVEWLISEGNEAPVLIVTGYNPHFAEAAKVFAKVRGRFQVSTLTKPMRIDALAQALTET